MKTLLGFLAAFLLLVLLVTPAAAQDPVPEIPVTQGMQLYVGLGGETPAPLGYMESVTWETMTSFAWAQLIIPMPIDNFFLIFETKQTMQRNTETMDRQDVDVLFKVAYKVPIFGG